ncbi:ABC transporter ATP-binding protein [Halorussus gelatinilyticus]|uniref:ABC transporter ATP-binding protein n=1 Tax=Halorussus gelatinilyticus TaxID=2937524 RepID=A0A8U0IFD4_9EURY|nr:ABC transporter ATP-binding protein [Halorussus gelatinilyticus]UPV99607.1 ABC transporter ATP-binding protein [Halorussus gelatinilyticus]
MQPTERRQKQPVISVENMRKTYADGSVVAVDDVSFEVERGSVVGLLGPNGAGKTSIIKSILGVVLPDEGDIRVDGVNVHEDDDVYEKVSAVLEGARNVYWRLTVRENISFFSSLQGIDPRNHRDEHDELMELLNIDHKADETVKNLSRGMKQKTALACALVRQTPVLFLDEPTLGLDVEASHDLRQELDRLVTQENRTVVLSSHDMDVMQDLCDRVIIIDDGEIVTDESVSGLVELFRTQAYEVVVEDDMSTTARRTLEREFDVAEWRERGDWTVCEVSMAEGDRVHDLMRTLEEFDLTPRSVSVVQPDLEDVFLEVTGEDETESERGSEPADESRTVEGRA